MSVSRALFLKEKFGPFEVGTRSRPAPGPGEVLVKEIATALNPVDWKIQVSGRFVSEYPAILGSDAAGEVEAVGEGVTQLKKGDKVFHQGGLTTGNDYSTFQEYAVVPAEIVWKLPTNITFDQAASLPLGVGTVVVPFYSSTPIGAGLKAPWDGGRGHYKGKPILVFGGASSVGQYAIQFAKLSGFSPIITTASLHNTNLLKSLGATHVVDRHVPASSFASEIAKITGKIDLVYDAIGSADIQQLGYDTVAEGGRIITVISPPAIKELSGSTKQVVRVFGNVHVPANRAIGIALTQHLPGLIEAGDIVPNQVEVLAGGLNAIADGLEKMKNNLVSAKKLVVHPGETV